MQQNPNPPNSGLGNSLEEGIKDFKTKWRSSF